MPQTLTVVQELTNRLSQIFNTVMRRFTPDEFTIEVNAMLPTLQNMQKNGTSEEIATAFMCKATAFAILHDKESALSACRNAINYGKNSPIVLFNTGSIHGFFGNPKEEELYFKKAYNLDSTNSTILDLLIATLWKTGKIRESVTWFEKRNALAPEKQPSETASSIISLLDDCEIPDTEIIRLAEIAYKIVREYNLVTPGIFIRPGCQPDQDKPEWVTIDVKVPATPERIAKLNHQLADEIAASYPPFPSSLLNIIQYEYTAEGMQP